MSRFILMVCLVCTIAFSGIASADMVIDWNNVLLGAIRTDNTPPPKSSRAMAMVHAAIYDSVNAIDKTYEPYHVQIAAASDTSREAATASAAYTVLSQLYPSQISTFNSALASSLAGIPDGASKTEGISLGQSVGNQIVEWRSNDNSNLVVPYTPSTDPGKWRPTPPNYAPALLPNWPKVTPFAMVYGGQFRMDGPPDIYSAEYAADVNETKSLGAIDSTTRTPYQTQTAFFWSDGGGTATPPGHWNEIAQQLAQIKGNTLSENARMFALLDISLADAAIVAWDDKYTYNLWRPITAIREAGDLNPLITPDPNWTPLLATPPFPECVSGHSTFSGAGAGILADFFGTNDIAFTVGSDAMPGVYRTYTSLWEAAQEAGMSRIYGGIHFEFSDGSALTAGNSLSNFVYQNYMQPVAVPDMPALALAAGGLLGVLRFGRRESC